MLFLSSLRVLLKDISPVLISRDMPLECFAILDVHIACFTVIGKTLLWRCSLIVHFLMSLQITRPLGLIFAFIAFVSLPGASTSGFQQVPL